jgi:methylenetetrahydrofolate reductase (NADPH)
MHVATILDRKRPTFSLEFFPPKTLDGWDRLFRVIRKFEALGPDFVSVTYGAGGTTREQTHELVRRIANETEVSVVPHLTCVCHSRGPALGRAGQARGLD